MHYYEIYNKEREFRMYSKKTTGWTTDESGFDSQQGKFLPQRPHEVWDLYRGSILGGEAG
jgi:alkylated DNA repair dioxygenase AlkB